MAQVTIEGKQLGNNSTYLSDDDYLSDSNTIYDKLMDIIDIKL